MKITRQDVIQSKVDTIRAIEDWLKIDHPVRRFHCQMGNRRFGVEGQARVWVYLMNGKGIAADIPFDADGNADLTGFAQGLPART